MVIPKKTLKKISTITVMDDVLRDTLKGDYFANEAPDCWNDQQKALYDMLCEVEYRFLDKVKDILDKPAPIKRSR